MFTLHTRTVTRRLNVVRETVLSCLPVFGRLINDVSDRVAVLQEVLHHIRLVLLQRYVQVLDLRQAVTSALTIRLTYTRHTTR